MQKSWPRRFYWGLVQAENTIGHLFLLIIRLYWGYLLFTIGLSKWMNLAETTQFFTSINIPAPGFSAWLAGLIEVVGGAALFLGLFSRVMSLILVFFFLIAYATAHPDAIMLLFSKPTAFFEESPFLYLFTSLIIFSVGPGYLSFDAWIERAIFGKKL